MSRRRRVLRHAFEDLAEVAEADGIAPCLDLAEIDPLTVLR
jgi:hypothetical protein